MSTSSAFVWDISPVLLQIGSLEIRYYGVLFATAFLVGFSLMEHFCKLEKRSDKDLDNILIVMVLGTVIGARLGHCLFYEPGYYLARPLEILKVWQGGLSSHGGAIGIILGLYLNSRKAKSLDFLWLLDRLSICTAFGGFCIRLGNFFNSEIVGRPTEVAWAVVFNSVDKIPRHPAQLYESISYLLIFFFLYYFYKRSNYQPVAGRLFGLFAVLVFGARFLIEFIKVPQVGFEAQMLLNMGQILSIPLILTGLWLLFRTPQNVDTKKISK